AKACADPHHDDRGRRGLVRHPPGPGGDARAGPGRRRACGRGAQPAVGIASRVWRGVGGGAGPRAPPGGGAGGARGVGAGGRIRAAVRAGAPQPGPGDRRPLRPEPVEAEAGLLTAVLHGHARRRGSAREALAPRGSCGRGAGPGRRGRAPVAGRAVGPGGGSRRVPRTGRGAGVAAGAARARRGGGAEPGEARLRGAPGGERLAHAGRALPPRAAGLHPRHAARGGPV
ncbi:MAG: hypothetical protein AVDCRST_MAG68-376, partial [uncultured Gemmatimonadetes bacterium]